MLHEDDDLAVEPVVAPDIDEWTMGEVKRERERGGGFQVDALLRPTPEIFSSPLFAFSSFFFLTMSSPVEASPRQTHTAGGFRVKVES